MVATVLGGALLVLAACGDKTPGEPASSPPRPTPDPARHVVLVTLDTLRADHVGAYGGAAAAATPHLDSLAAQGALLEEVWTHVPLTRPAHVSLFSGLLPTLTGVRDNVSPAAVPDAPLLAEVLKGEGFETGAFVSAAVVARASGLDRGFDVYSDELGAGRQDPDFLNTAQRRGDETLAEAVAWLEAKVAQAGSSRLFLWLHLYDPHEPYDPPEPYATRYAQRPYAGEVAWTDELVGRLDAALERLGLARETLLVVTSDHGEGLGDHDELLHGFFAYESTLRVPLLLRGAGIVAGLRLARPTGLVDLYPTVLDLAGLAAPEGRLSGQSLAPLLRGEKAPEPASEAAVYAESLVARLHFGWGELRAVRRGGWKYIDAPRPELYDLGHDPGETQNLVDAHRSEARRLRRALERFRVQEEAGGQGGPPVTGALPEQRLEELGALGYVGGGSPARTTTPGADPKDKIAEFRLANGLLRAALAHLRNGEYRSGAEKLQALLDAGIESGEIHFHLARAHLALNELPTARRHFEASTQQSTLRAAAWLGLAESRLELGDAPGALAALRDGARALPRHGGLRVQEARLLRRLARPDEARRTLEVALELLPRDAYVRALLGEVLRDLGDVDEALRWLRQAVEMEPTRASFWNGLGMTLGGRGGGAGLQEAEGSFRRAHDLDPDHHLYAYNLGLVLLRLGRGGEARPYFERALELAPDFEPARRQLDEPRR